MRGIDHIIYCYDKLVLCLQNHCHSCTLPSREEMMDLFQRPNSYFTSWTFTLLEQTPPPRHCSLHSSTSWPIQRFRVCLLYLLMLTFRKCLSTNTVVVVVDYSSKKRCQAILISTFDLSPFFWQTPFPLVFSERCQQEIDTVLEGKEHASFEDRHRMPYTQAVTHESQRIASTVPLSVFHSTTTDTEVMGYSIPKVRSSNTSKMLALICHSTPNVNSFFSSLITGFSYFTALLSFQTSRLCCTKRVSESSPMSSSP